MGAYTEMGTYSGEYGIGSNRLGTEPLTYVAFSTGDNLLRLTVGLVRQRERGQIVPGGFLVIEGWLTCLLSQRGSASVVRPSCSKGF